MLKLLRIQNFAIIENMEIEFGTGLNIFSGETGAGKSIVMEALNMILGGRASSNIIRQGAESASVEALFEIEDKSFLAGVLESSGISFDEEKFIVRRVIQPSGKSRAYINNSMASLQTLQQITAPFVDICSQGDQQLLVKSEEQLLWLDRYGDLTDLRNFVKERFMLWKERLGALKKLEADSTDRAQRIDFLKFQLKELNEAELSNPNEDEEIKQELEVLSNSETLCAFAKESEAAIYGIDDSQKSMLDVLNGLVQKAESLVKTDPKLTPAYELMNSLKVTVEEAGYFFRDYTKSIVVDESRLEELNIRYNILNQLKRKYGPELEKVMASRDRFTEELQSFENHKESSQIAKAAVHESRELLDTEARVLSEKRSVVSRAFGQDVEKELSELNMLEARFIVDVNTLEDPTVNGTNRVEYKIAANPGELPQAIQKVASGGELSRIMLALHNVLSAKDRIHLYLFDEVDAGIGGKTAATVGKKLQQVAKNNQVICITHLPQVACFANHHFRVEKSIEEKNGEARTICSVLSLKKEDRTLEIARMLSGVENDEKALANAESMLSNSHAN